MKAFLAVILASTLLQAQLVEKAPSPPARSNRASHKEETRAATTPVQEEPTPTPDLIETLGLSKEFIGAVIDKKTERVLLTFTGSWKDAPTIQGGSSTITYSKRAAYLCDFLSPSTSSYFLFSFNLGQKNGQISARTFTWPKETYGNGDRSVVQQDEGYGSVSNGVYSFDLEKQRILFRPLKNGVWKPDSARLLRWEGSDFQSELVPKHPNGDYGDWDNANQWAPVWACGSYLVLSDGFLSKAYFRFFGGSVTYVIPGIMSSDGAMAYGPTSHCAADQVKLGGFESLARLWDSGLYMSDGNVGASDWTIEFQTIFKFRRDWSLSSVSTLGKINDGKSLTSEIAGESQSVALSENMLAEVLDRSRESGWVNSAGPYSLKRILLGAFQGTKLIAPTPALSIQPNDYKGSSAQMFSEESLKRWKVGCSRWSSDADTAGAQFIVPKITGRSAQKKPAPLGRIAAANDLVDSDPQANTSVPLSERSMEQPIRPTAKGAYVLLDNKWVALPHNNGKVTQSAGTVLMSFGSSAYSTTKLAELVFDGRDSVPEVAAENVNILFVGVDAAANEAFSRQHPELRNYPLIEMARTRTSGNGKRLADLVRIAPGMAGFGNHRCAGAIEQPDANSVLLKTSATQPGTYAVMTGRGELYELTVKP